MISQAYLDAIFRSHFISRDFNPTMDHGLYADCHFTREYHHRYCVTSPFETEQRTFGRPRSSKGLANIFLPSAQNFHISFYLPKV